MPTVGLIQERRSWIGIEYRPENVTDIGETMEFAVIVALKRLAKTLLRMG